MNPVMILKAEWRRSWHGIVALAFVLGLSISLGLALSMLERGVRQGAAQAGDAFDLLIGSPGSPTQLLLSTVYLQPQPLPLMPEDVYSRIAASPGVEWAAPLAFGDRWQQHPLVGTTALLPTLAGKRPLAAGTTFTNHNQAVIGAKVALSIGQTFTPEHGLIALPEKGHEHPDSHFTVVGRMPATGSPWDNAILVPLEAVWETHGLHQGDAGAGFSAVVVKPNSVAAAYKLRGAWQTPQTQAVFTGEVLTQLFSTLGDVRALMQGMASMAQAIALAGVLITTVFAVALRRDSLSLLRILGAPRSYLMACIWGLAGCVILGGVLLGVALALLEAHTVALVIGSQVATALPVHVTEKEWYMAGLFALIGLVTAGGPALCTYKRIM